MDVSESEDSLYLSVVSATDRVPIVLERVAQFARRQGVSDSDGLLLVVRELLDNAIVHGNESNPARMALVRVARRGAFFEVQVDDEGEGFDYESLILGLPEDPQTLTQRGLVLAHELSEELSFERGGSRVRAIVDPGGKNFDSDRDPVGFSPEGYAGEKSIREEICISPMAKSV
jgi:anti-sigma regulatory factor (Ser/Thr protein kinase)